jgi:hypothetical protein
MAETLVEYFGASMYYVDLLRLLCWLLLIYRSPTDAKKLDEFDVEDILVQIMSDEFHTDLEDGSAYAVSSPSQLSSRTGCI